VCDTAHARDTAAAMRARVAPSQAAAHALTVPAPRRSARPCAAAAVAAAAGSPDRTPRHATRRCTARDVALFVPNLLTYARAALLLGVPVAAPSHPLTAAALYAAAAALDAADGAAARALGQASGYGAFLDVAVDNVARALMWALASGAGAPLAVAALPALEGLTFAATHAGAGAAWKADAFASAPPTGLVAWLSRDAFRTPQGVCLMAGLHFAPLALFLRPVAAAGGWAAAPAWRATLAALLTARAAAALVELWLLRRHLRAMLHRDAAARNEQQQQEDEEEE
jgi:CDP-diacylglycerol--inositol 3-phosphatidyltransferase